MRKAIALLLISHWGRCTMRTSVKNNWLWTTITKGGQPYDFDSFRVFVWSLRHHRYETAYIERNVVGHYPVEVIECRCALPSFSDCASKATDGQPIS